MKTAVEWLINELGLDNDSYSMKRINQAKEMEKQQIIDAYENGYSDSDNTFELNKGYYNETFKTK